MVGKLKKTIATVAAALSVVPLAACGAKTDNGLIAPETYTSAIESVVSQPSADTSVNYVIENGARETEVSPWDGDLVKAGWGASEAGKVKPDDYDDSVENTINIGSADALAYFAHEVYLESNNGFAGYTVTLTCDIDLQGNLWIPIGFDNRVGADCKLPHAFRGTFVGADNGKTIYGFDADAFFESIVFEGGKYYVEQGDVKVELVTDDGEFHYGLFGATGNATVKNINIDSFNFDFKSFYEKQTDEDIKKLIPDSVAALIGFAGGSLTVENCTVGKEGDSITGVNEAGGVVGRAYTGYNATSGQFGNKPSITPGIEKNDVLIKDCTNYITLGGANEVFKELKRGGIIGYINYSKTLSVINCKNYGDIYGQYIGGLLSYQQGGDDWIFENCVNYGNIVQKGDGGSGGSYAAGGLVGRLENGGSTFRMTNCFNYGNVTAEFAAWAGGFIGNLTLSAALSAESQKITACFNYGDIYVASSAVNGGATTSIVGGIVGNIGSNSVAAGVGNCGRVTGGGTLGGCFGSGKPSSILYEINGYEVPKA